MGIRTMMKRAEEAQSGVIVDESRRRYNNDPPDPEEVRQDVRYIRQDMVLISFYLTQTYGMLLSIRRLVVAFGLAIVYILARMAW